MIGLSEAGWSNRRISHYVGRRDMVVARWQHWITECTVSSHSGSGRPDHKRTKESSNQERSHVYSNNVAIIDSTTAVCQLAWIQWYQVIPTVDDLETLGSGLDVH
ncbi:hypothetical protein AVEN_222142-1 [Araneus ventricosus]|uniref:Uncharacterized protein n=1 Tax=Araneus ventricosus TaxID=182803 RepID=A0A4Y2IME8_ARAVE|nr:hypothetical protein AVEN_222142-1 [Araneus ventricosus]